MANTKLVRNTEWKALKGAFYKIEENVLVTTPMTNKGTIDYSQLKEGAIMVEYLVSGEEEERFLENINEIFGTDFTYSQFIK